MNVVEGTTVLNDDILISKEQDTVLVKDNSKDDSIPEQTEKGDNITIEDMTENPSKKMCFRVKSLEEMKDRVTTNLFKDHEDLKLQPTNRSYKCEQCDFSGDGRAVIKKHIQDKHGFPCDQCNYIAITRGNFWKHKRSLH